MTAQGPDELQVLSRIQCVMSLSTITVVGAIKIYSCYLHLTLLNNMNEYYKVALFVLQKVVCLLLAIYSLIIMLQVI
jgi:hypothetical protein